MGDPLGLFSTKRPASQSRPQSREDDPLGLFGDEGAPADFSDVQTGASTAPTPRRGIVSGLGAAINDWLKGGGVSSIPSPVTMNPAAAAVREQVERHAEPRRLQPGVDRRTPAQQRADALAEVRAGATTPVDVTSAPSPARAQQRAAERQTMATRAAERKEFSPEHMQQVAVKGAQYAQQLHAQGRHDEAQEIDRMAANAQLVASGAREADTHGAIILSNLLGILQDPYAGQRINLATARQPGMLPSPEQQRAMGIERPVAPEREFSAVKDIADPLVGMAPAIVVAGGAGRLATATAGTALEEMGATRIGAALGRAAEGITVPEALGPRVPVRSVRHLGLRIGEEVQAFRAALPSVMARGATEGQIVMGVQQYQMARQQGASVEEAASAALQGALLNMPMGAAAEAGFGLVGRAAGVGFDPVQQMVRAIRERTVPREVPDAAITAADAGRAAEGQLPVSDQMVEPMHRKIADALDQVLGQKQADEAAAGRELIEPAPGLRTRETAPNAPLRSAAELAMERTRPSDDANALVRMQREQEFARAARAEAERMAQEPDLQLELAAQARPSEKQGPLTLGQTIARAARERDAGEPLATEYHEAINHYVDALTTITDLPEDKEPSLRQRVVLARARQALNDARKQYGAQVGASAVLALAANDDDLTDDEKKLVGLGALAIGATAVVPAIPREVRARIWSHVADNFDAPRTAAEWSAVLKQGGIASDAQLAEVRRALDRIQEAKPNDLLTLHDVKRALAPDEPESGDAVRGKFYSRLRKAIETLPGKRWDQPVPAADWIGKLKGLGTFSKKELELMLPQLDEAAARKQKLSREDVLSVADATLPELERITLGALEETRTPERVGGPAGGPYDSSDIEDIDDVLAMHADAPDELHRQYHNRQARIAELQEKIADDQEFYRREMEEAENRLQSIHEDMNDSLREADISTDVLEPALDYLREHVESEYVPRGAVENAFSAIMDDLYTSRSPEDVLREAGYTWSTETVTPPPRRRVRSRWETPVEHPFIPGRGAVTGFDYPITEGRTNAEHVERARQFGEEAVRNIEFYDQPQEPEERVVVRNAEGKEIASDFDEETALREAAEQEGLDVDDSDLPDTIRRRLDDYAYALAEYQRKEGEHYIRSEDEQEFYDEETREIERLQEEQDRLDGAISDAREREADRAAAPPPALPAGPEPETPDNPYLTPVNPEIVGRAQFEESQEIGGGKDYFELLTRYDNPPLPGNRIPTRAYGEHDYWSSRLPGELGQNIIGHVRGRVHRVFDTPDIDAPEIQFIEGEPGPIHGLKENIADARKLRQEDLRDLQRITDQYMALRPEERTASNPRARELAEEYRRVNEHAHELATKEEVYAKRVRELRSDDRTGRDLRVYVESQPSFAQHQAHLPPPADPAALAAAQALVDRLREEYVAAVAQDDVLQREANQLDAALNRQIEAHWSSGASYQELLDRMNAATGQRRTHLPANRRVREPEAAPAFDWMAQEFPEMAPTIAAYREALDRQDAYYAHANELASQITVAKEALREFGPQEERVDIPFSDTPAALRVNAARMLFDAAERGESEFAFSDAANRVANAHNPIGLADFVYNQVTPKAITSLLEGLGFKNVPIDKITIRGWGHWRVKLTPAMREAIRKTGLPILGLLALAGAPSDAEAQDGRGGQRRGGLSPYATAAGGLIAGAALTALLTSKKLRRLVMENRALSEALHRDDLSGLANKRAFSIARDVVDADPDHAWVTFDGSQFKRVNDVAGHMAGDKAIARFGRAIIEAARETGIAMRGFRPGGDEFAVAVPKAQAQQFIDIVEAKSRHVVSGVETQLHGMWGETYAQADALLLQRKEELRRLNPELRRSTDLPPGSPQEAQMIAEEIAKAELPKDAPDGLKLYANPIGPALRQLARYPGAMALAGVGTIMADSDNENVRRAGPPTIALAALSMIGSHRLAMAKDVFGAGVLKLLGRSETGRAVVDYFNPDAMLSRDAKRALDQYRETVAYGRATALEHGGKAQALGPEGNRAVSDVIEQESWEDVSGFTPQQMQDVLTVAAGIEAEVKKLTAAKIQHGVLRPEQALAGYLKREYAYFDALDAVAEHQGRGTVAGKTIGAATKSRVLDEPIRAAEEALADARASGNPQQITDAEDQLTEAQLVQQQQRVTLGEIREAGYRASATFDQGWHDVAAAKLHETLRAVPGTVHPEYDRALGEFLTARSLFKAATTKADRDAAKGLMDAAYIDMRDIGDRFKAKGGEWRTLPDTRSYGVLRGMPVARNIFYELAPAFDPNGWDRFINFWKQSKTIFNPTTSVGNIMSNVFFAHMEGMHLYEQPLWLKRAYDDLRAYGPATRHLSETGVLEASAAFSPNEIQNPKAQRSEAGLGELLATTRPETQAVLRERGITEASVTRRKRRGATGRALAGAAVGAGLLADADNPEDMALGAGLGGLAGLALTPKVRALVRRGYANEDNLFRIAFYLKDIGRGIPKDIAAQHARRSLGDMTAPASPATQFVRRNLSPFLLYPLRAIPRFAQQAIDHPWRYVALMGGMAAIDLYARGKVGPVEERDIAPEDRRDTFGYFLPGFTQLPFVNERGEKANVDLARWTPLSAMTSAAPPGTTGGAISDQFPTFLQPSGPLLDIGARVTANRDPFSGDPLLKKDYPLGENLAEVGRQAAEVVAPSTLAFHRRRLQEDIANRDWDKFKNDILSPSGMRPRFTRPGGQVRRSLFQLEDDLTAMKREFNQAMIANKNPERSAEIVQQYLRRVTSALDHFSRRMGPPPKDVVDRAMDTHVTGVTGPP